jgi:glutathione peroxidase
MLKLLVLVLLLIILTCCYSADDKHQSCKYWASIGECESNPNYMLANCPVACNEAKLNANNQLNNNIIIPDTFYDIKEIDENGKVIDFKIFDNKVVYLINTASHCGYTASNFEQFAKLASLKDKGLEIVIAPCNQFGKQEPGDSIAIKEFAESRNFQGIILSKDDVNGQYTRPSFAYLKKVTGKNHINWNFDGNHYHHYYYYY